MARFVVGAVFGLVVGVVGAAALSIHAEPDEVEAAALEAGVDPVALAGAVNTTGVGPREYLRGVGEANTRAPSGSAELHPADAVAVSQASTPPVPTVWATLAQCESTSNWRANTGNGYSGGLQFDRQTWLAYGGGMYAPAAYLASPSQQVAIAERVRAARGFAPWPACSRRLGLR